ncbi:MAG: VOC family protein, partial [Pseudomonadota bacterium]
SPAAERSPAVPVQGPGIAHVCFQAAQETGIYQKFRRSGAVPVGEPDLVQINERRPVWYAYSRDADGIMFEVEHIDVAALDLPEPPRYDRRLRHVSISTPDLKRLVAFYRELLDEDEPRRVGRLFGGISGETLDQVAGLDDVKIAMAWFQVGNLELEIIQYKSHPTELPAQPRPLDALGYNMIVFDAADLDAAAAKLTAAGGTVATQPEPKDGGMIFFGRDPDGNLLGFQTANPGSLVSSEQFDIQGT